MLKKKSVIFLVLAFSILTIRCSTEKNTATTRAYHNLTAHYNVFFNAKTAYEQAVTDAEKKCTPDYSLFLPLFPYQCPNTKNVTGNKMNRVMEKAAKTISRHSITAKPKMRNTKNLSPNQIAFYKKKEYCKWIDDSYLLIGKANFYKQDYTKALNAFRLILSKYPYNNVKHETKLWIAKTYIMQNRLHDAQEYLDNLEQDTLFPKKLRKELYLTFTDLYIHQQKYDKAITYLEKAIKKSHSSREKARLTFILAQLYLETGQKNKAANLFAKVGKYNAPYELEFNAKLYLATVADQNLKPDKIKRRLEKLLKDEKNEEYKDKIYFALAKLELNRQDTAAAIEYLKHSAAFSSDGTTKAVSYLALGDLFFEKGNFIKAGQYYDSTMQYLPKEYKDFNKIQRKSKDLIELSANYQTVFKNDSLLKLASLPKKDLYKIIDSIIAAKKEAQKSQEANYNYFDYQDQNNNMNSQQTQGGKWYFYNPVLVSRGEQSFKQKWGNRKLEDNWRRKNKAAQAFDNQNENNQKKTNEINEFTRDFYLAQLPMTDSAKSTLKDQIAEAYFNIAQIYQYKINDYKKAADAYEKYLSLSSKKQFEQEAYFNLYNLWSALKNSTKAQYYKNLLQNKYPNSVYTKIITIPGFYEKLQKNSKKAEDALWQTIDSYNKNQYNKVLKLTDKYIKLYDGSPTIPSFILLRAKAFGNLGYQDSMRFYLNKLQKNYPDTKQAKLATEILNKIKQQEQLRRMFKYSPAAEHYIIFSSDDKTILNKYKFLLFKYANEFDKESAYKAEIDKIGKKSVVILKTFSNKNKAENFINFLKQKNVKTDGMILISPQNLTQVKKLNSLEKYMIFYSQYYKL